MTRVDRIVDSMTRVAHCHIVDTCVGSKVESSPRRTGDDGPRHDGAGGGGDDGGGAGDVDVVMAAEETLFEAYGQGMRVGGISKVVQDAAYSGVFTGERLEGEGGGGDDIGDGGRGGGGGDVSGAGVSDALMDADESIKDGED